MTRVVNQLADSLVPISLAEVIERAALLTRTDRKYIVPHALVPPLTQLWDRQGVRVVDVNNNRCVSYESVYFDTPTNDSYERTLTRRRHRYKVRTRTYADSGDTFLEVKTRDGRGATVKDRIPHASRTHLDPDSCAFIRSVLAARGVTRPPRQLAPVVFSTYQRTTVTDLTMRVTLDTELTWHHPNGRRYDAGDIVILETKTPGHPSTTDRWLWQHGVRPTTISKFATGRAALDPTLPAHRWNRTLTRTFADAPRFSSATAFGRSA